MGAGGNATQMAGKQDVRSEEGGQVADQHDASGGRGKPYSAGDVSATGSSEKSSS